LKGGGGITINVLKKGKKIKFHQAIPGEKSHHVAKCTKRGGENSSGCLCMKVAHKFNNNLNAKSYAGSTSK